MKKLISILLVSSLAVGMAGCQGSTQETAEQETITEEVVEEPEDEVVEETVEEPESISLGEQVEVNTEYGDFLLTVDNVRKCDWVERNGGEADKYVAVLVECDIENISYEDPYNDVFWIDQFLIFTGDDGYIVDTLSYGYDDGLYSASSTLEIPTGSKGRIFVAYNCGIDVQSISIDINNQYVLTAPVESEADSGDTEENVDEVETTSTESYDNRDFVSVIERMATLPTNGHIDLSDLVEVDEDGQNLMGYNVRYTSDDVNASIFQVLCNPDNDGIISMAMIPETLDSDSGDLDYSYAIVYLVMAVDDTLSFDDATSLVQKVIDQADEDVTKNDITYSFSSSTMYLYISY